MRPKQWSKLETVNKNVYLIVYDQCCLQGGVWEFVLNELSFFLIQF